MSAFTDGASSRAGPSPDDPTVVGLDVALAPSLLSQPARPPSTTVYIVVDVIRATTTLAVLMQRGCARVFIAADTARARAAAAEMSSGRGAGERPLLLGEVGGVAPEGFDYGNSPDELSAIAFAGRTVIFATTNGTRAFHACASFGPVLAGAARNATATAAAALARAARLGAAANVPAAITIVCAGRDDAPAYDDTVCAGYLAHRVTALAALAGRDVALTEPARIALATVPDPTDTFALRAALASSVAFQSIADLGLAADLDWCAALDTSSVVCGTAGADACDGLLTVTPWES